MRQSLTLTFYSFGFETAKETAGCRALNRNFIVGGIDALIDFLTAKIAFSDAISSFFIFYEKLKNCLDKCLKWASFCAIPGRFLMCGL